MKVALVLIVKDWAALEEAYAFEHAFGSLARVGLSDSFQVLVCEGFERIPAAVVGRWRERRIVIEDAAPVLASLVAEEPAFSGLPDNPVYRVTLMRHLILERRFGGEPVLSVDADIVWRTDPYRLFGAWRGGDFTMAGSGSLVYAASPDWFAAYRAGLKSALTGGALTADFREAKFGIDRVLHDQHLIRHLEAKGLIADAWEVFRTSPEARGRALLFNPLYPKAGLVDPPPRIAFERNGDEERFSGSEVAFWHMQSSFSALCGFFFIAEGLVERHGGRLPFPRPKAGRDNLKAALLHQMRELIIAGQVEEPRLKALRPLMFRRGVYKAFFKGRFPARLFSDRYWWEPGVFS